METKTRILSHKRCNSIDLFKFIFAFFIIALHTCPFADFQKNSLLEIFFTFSDIAVSFFFLSSGFLLASKMNMPYGSDKNIDMISSQLKKMIKMYLIWTAVYFPLAVYGFAEKNETPVRCVITYIVKFFFRGEQHNSWHLWYLLSTVYALFILKLLMKKIKNPSNFIAVSVFFGIVSVAFTALSEYDGDLPTVLMFFRKLIFLTFSNGRIFQGLLYIPLGMFLARKKLPSYLNCIVFIASFVTNIYVENSIFSFVLTIFSSVSFFAAVINVNLKDSVSYEKMRNLSKYMYLTHMYVWVLYSLLFYGEKTTGAVAFIVTSVVTIVLSFVIIYINNKKLNNKKQKLI